jgi:hypothetical protein
MSVFGTLGVAGVLEYVTMNTATTADVESSIGQRFLQGDGEHDNNNAGENFLIVWKVLLVVMGIGLSLLIHFFKMLVRISGLVCCCGCCQPCITILELTAVCLGVVFAIFIQPIAIVTCLLLIIAAIYTVRVKFCQKKNNDQQENNNQGIQPATATTFQNDDSIKLDQPPKDDHGTENNSSNVVLPHPMFNAIESDPENPQPSAPLDEPISISEVTPLPLPPATNPSHYNVDTPIAIAVPISMEDQKNLDNTSSLYINQ